MARFYLNIRRNGTFIADPEGDEVPNLEAAKELALETLHEMRRLPHVYGEPAVWENREFIITDEQENHVLTIPFRQM